MKKYSLYIIAIPLAILVLFGFLYWQGNTQKEITNEKDIDIENTVVECKSGEQYLGKDLIGKDINFQLIGSRIFYKGEELERLCNPQLKEYNDEAEQSYRIIPVYLKS